MPKAKPIALASDHAGFEMKTAIIAYLVNSGFTVTDFGTYSNDSVDYPDYIHPLTNAIEDGMSNLGIIFCGSGNGVAMTANKHQDIRAALAWNDQIATLARNHNDANVLAVPARYVDLDAAKKMVDAFLAHTFEGGRHKRRVDKIPNK